MNGPSLPSKVNVVAVIGAGLIGASWVAWLSARGFQVLVYDPAPEAPAKVEEMLTRAWPDLVKLGIAEGAAAPRPTFAPTMADAVSGADLVLECGPERLDWKRDVAAQIDEAAQAHAVIATCTSSLLVSDIQAQMRRPERLIAAHPFNPPHLLPLVEIAGGAHSDPAVIEWAMAFFKQQGKTPVRVLREAPGFIANRLTAALYREAVNLVVTGVATVADVDAAVAAGPGLRWAVMGPHLLYHLGAAGGYRAYLDHLGPAQEARWRTLGAPTLDEATKAALVDGIEVETDGQSVASLAAQRDAGLLAILTALKNAE